MMQSFVIVDDSRAIQAIIRRSIDACGYGQARIQAHSSAQAALDALDAPESTLPDLLITDWHMPGMSGLELLQVLRQIHGTDIKIGMVTTETSPELLRQAREQGVSFILHKPFTDSEMRASIHGAIGPPRPGADAPTDTARPAKAAVEEAAVAIDRHALMCEALGASLGPIKFRLVSCEVPPIEQLSSRVLLGLYSLAGTKSAYALGLVDMASTCMLGGGGLGMQPAVVRPALAAGEPSEAMIRQASVFLRHAAKALLNADSEVPAASRGTVVDRDLEKLRSSMTQHSAAQSYRLQIPGYGEGRMVFLVL
jgi:CheY-like chemotaxis protein